MLIVQNNIVPFKGYIAMFFFGILFVRGDKESLSEKTLIHEGIHSKQCWELLGIFFYIWYLIEWLIKCVMYGNSNKAYRNICFEKEAYENEGDESYLENRRLFNFIKYL